MSMTKILQLAICVTFFSVILNGCSESGEPPASEVSVEPILQLDPQAPAGRLSDSVVPVHYRLELKIDPTQETFSGTVAIDVTFGESRDSVWLHGKNMDVSEVYLTQGPSGRINASYEEHLESGVALVSLEKAAKTGPATLNFTFSAPFNTSSSALFKAVRGEESYAVTQFEPIAARQAFPGFDEPGFKVPFDLSLVTRADHVAITTTPEVSTEDLGDGFVRHFYATTRPLPTYLIAFAVGPFDLVDYGMIPANSIRDREVALRAVAAKGLGPRLDYALKHTAGLLTALEEYFGTPYPYRKLDLIAVPQSFGGAMENVGAITYDEYLVLMDEESSLSQRRSFTSVHAHEMAHMWFGNLVTPGWWNDIWLNESFATWMMNKAANSYWPEGEFDRETLKGALGAMANDSLAAAREIREPIDHNDKITGAFDGITYQKGGGVLAMLERYIGEDNFQAGIRLHMERHTDKTATAEDFIQSLADGSGHAEIEAAFKSYIEQPGVPLVSVHVNCDDEQNPRLEVSQARYAPLGSAIIPEDSKWLIPMCVNYLADGTQKSTCAMLNEGKQSIKLDSSVCPSQVHPNADGAGYYRFSMDETWWDGLIANTSNLAPAEALVLADSLDAAFRAGTVPAKTYVAGMEALVNHSAWDVADAAITHLEQIASVPDVSLLAPLEQALRNIVRPRFEQLANPSDPGSKLLNTRMQRFLIVIAKDQAMREPLAKQAAARIGLNGDPDLSAAPADQLETILSIGVQDLGEPFFDLLLEQAIASEDPAFRNSATGALARVEDPEQVSKLQAAVLGKKFKGTEAIGIIFRQMFRPATTELTYAWIKENEADVIEMIPETFRSNIVPGLGGAFCSAARADEWQEFITSRSDKLPGYERPLAQATESIRLCAALRQAKAAELLAAFENY